MKKLLLPLVFLLGACAHGGMEIHFPIDPDTDIPEKGPISYFCLRDGALSGKPTNKLICIDYVKFYKSMRVIHGGD